MRVAITGASGFIGTTLLKVLSERGYPISVLVRRPEDLQFPADQMKLIPGDIQNDESLNELVVNSDAVVHMAAFVHKESLSEDRVRECFAVNVDGTRRLIQAIRHSGRSQYLIYLSTIAVYGSKFSMAKEDSVCQPVSAYGISKLHAEELVRGAIRDGLITGCVLRPAMVCGMNAPGNLQKMIQVMRSGIFPLIGGGENQKSLVYVKDLAAVIVKCLENEDITNEQVYNVAANPPLSIRQIAAALERGMGRCPFYLPVSGWLAESLAKFSFAPVKKLQGWSRSIETFCSTNTVDTAALSGHLQIRFHSTENVLAEIAAHSTFRSSLP